MENLTNFSKESLKMYQNNSPLIPQVEIGRLYIKIMIGILIWNFDSLIHDLFPIYVACDV